MTILNKDNCILDVVQSYQLETSESQDLCGPWSVGALRLAGIPGKGPRGNAEDVDVWTDKEVNKYMAQGQQNWPGSSVDDMYNFMTDSLDKDTGQRNIHWWDMNPISLQNIRLAVKSGYPVIVTANEQNIIEKRTGKRPYPWNLNVNHVFPVIGIDKDGDFICADELNNSFQGYWPVVYLANRLQPSWTTIAQITGGDDKNPWLAAIPSGNPSTWPAGFNAQQFVDAKGLQRHAIWNGAIPGLRYNTGISNLWNSTLQEKYLIGTPVTQELNTVDWNNNPIIIQWFTEGHVEWSTKTRAWVRGSEVTI